MTPTSFIPAPYSDAGRILCALRDADRPIHVDRISLAARVQYSDACKAVDHLLSASLVQRDGNLLRYVYPVPETVHPDISPIDAVRGALEQARGRPLSLGGICGYVDFPEAVVRNALRNLLAQREVLVTPDPDRHIPGRPSNLYTLARKPK